jgi:hypothetical protein
MQHIFPGNPLDALPRYVRLTDWSLLETVRAWEDDPVPAKQRLGKEWATILRRQVKWKMAYDTTFTVHGKERQPLQSSAPDQLLARIRQALPLAWRNTPVQLDTATQDPRNINPLVIGESPVYIYDPATEDVQTELLEKILEYIPMKIVQYRVYTTNHTHKHLLAQACEQAFTTDQVLW